MAVPRRKTSPSRRGMRRSADALKKPTYAEDKDSGELRRPHHLDLKTGMYKGRQVLKAKKESCPRPPRPGQAGGHVARHQDPDRPGTARARHPGHLDKRRPKRARVLVLLRHKFIRSRRAAEARQQGHR